MAEKTLEDFTNEIDWAYFAVTLLYIFIVLVLSTVVGVTQCWKCKKKQAAKKQAAKKQADIELKTREHNEGGEGAQKIKQEGWLSKCIICFNTWLIRLIFGKPEGISEKENSKVQVDNEGISENENSKDNGSIHINGKKIENVDINILGTIILCFALLVGITAYSAYLLDVTHTCSDDPAIFCFPQLLDQNDPENPNITAEELTYPIADCSQWINSSISPKVTFQCFRYAFNANAALVVAGGLLAFFTVVTRATISLLVKCGKRCNKNCLNCTQVITVAIMILVIAVTAVVVMAFQVHDRLGMIETEENPVAQQTATYIADNGIQFLIIVGTVTLLLLIPWSHYGKK